MLYNSTRDNDAIVNSSVAIAHGISKEGGLFVPQSVPSLSDEDFSNLKGMNYVERANFVLGKFLTDFTADELNYCTKGAYLGSFDNDAPAPVKALDDTVNILELWHGPTCAFKDLALQILPYLLTTSAKKVSGDKKTVILVATSGDTGKAALEGFKDVKDTEIIVFYPNDGVSAMQQLQMNTQKGENVYVCAINGNFDDAQTGVKTIFTDDKVKALLEENGMEFSSANSINWGRLAPQIIYYISAYCDLLEKGDDYLKDGFNVVVPTGNFGNILAAYYAKEMGVPINKLICASNSNNVLTDFLNGGTYDRNRNFYTTISPSMDILISSNLERMLYELTGHNDKKIAKWQNELKESGKYTVDEDVFAKLKELFWGGFCSEESTAKTIKETLDKYGYIIDTHTAVAVSVYNDYRKQTGDSRPVVIASTASPYKFANSVLEAIGEKANENEFEAVGLLSKLTNTDIPKPISDLEAAQIRFNNVCNKEDMNKVVLERLGIK
ncbi:MAG: threonine synthase [Clostridia bacterium]|nr:threonine synthase [Clostridia bacterium]